MDKDLIFLTTNNYKNFIENKKRTGSAAFHYFKDCKWMWSDYDDGLQHQDNSKPVPQSGSKIPELLRLKYTECSLCRFNANQEQLEKETDYNPIKYENLELDSKRRIELKAYILELFDSPIMKTDDEFHLLYTLIKTSVDYLESFLLDDKESLVKFKQAADRLDEICLPTFVKQVSDMTNRIRGW